MIPVDFSAAVSTGSCVVLYSCEKEFYLAALAARTDLILEPAERLAVMRPLLVAVCVDYDASKIPPAVRRYVELVRIDLACDGAGDEPRALPPQLRGFPAPHCCIHSSLLMHLVALGSSLSVEAEQELLRRLPARPHVIGLHSDLLLRPDALRHSNLLRTLLHRHARLRTNPVRDSSWLMLFGSFIQAHYPWSLLLEPQKNTALGPVFPAAFAIQEAIVSRCRKELLRASLRTPGRMPAFPGTTPSAEDLAFYQPWVQMPISEACAMYDESSVGYPMPPSSETPEGDWWLKTLAQRRMLSSTAATSAAAGTNSALSPPPPAATQQPFLSHVAWPALAVRDEGPYGVSLRPVLLHEELLCAYRGARQEK
jgi:hypothetical protein